jgi:hypothetical protein
MAVANSILSIRKYKQEEVLLLAEQCLRLTLELLLTQDALVEAYPKALDVLRVITEPYRKFLSLNHQAELNLPRPAIPMDPEEYREFVSNLKAGDQVDILKTD